MPDPHEIEEQNDALLTLLSNGGHDLRLAILNGRVAVSRIVTALPPDVAAYFEADGALRGSDGDARGTRDDACLLAAKALDLRVRVFEKIREKLGGARAAAWPACWPGTLIAHEVHRLATTAVTVACFGHLSNDSAQPFAVLEDVLHAPVTRLYVFAAQLLAAPDRPWGEARRCAAFCRQITVWLQEALDALDAVEAPDVFNDPMQSIFDECRAQIANVATMLHAAGDPVGDRLRALLDIGDDAVSSLKREKVHAEALLADLERADALQPVDARGIEFLAFANARGWGPRPHAATFEAALEVLLRGERGGGASPSRARRCEASLSALGFDPRTFLGATKERERKATLLQKIEQQRSSEPSEFRVRVVGALRSGKGDPGRAATFLGNCGRNTLIGWIKGDGALHRQVVDKYADLQAELGPAPTACGDEASPSRSLKTRTRRKTI
jgi:hypothetical protein